MIAIRQGILPRPAFTFRDTPKKGCDGRSFRRIVFDIFTIPLLIQLLQSALEGSSSGQAQMEVYIQIVADGNGGKRGI